MPLDPNGPVDVAPTPDTTAESSVAPDPGPTADGAPAVESRSGDETTAPEPTPGDEPAEDDGDGEGTEDDGEQTEEQQKLSRRERQRLREQERIEREVAERLAAKEREATEAAEREKREAEARKAREQAAREFAEYIGEPDEDARLRDEIADLNRQIRSEVANPNGADLDALEAKVSKAEARLAEITRARGFQDKIAANLWNGIEAHVMSPLQWPEFSDPATKQRYLGAEGGIAGALGVLKDVLRTAWQAEVDAERAETKKQHDSEVATLREELRGWRVRAGAEEVPDTTSGGPAVSSGAMTRTEFMRLPKEQKDRMRREQPAVVAAIYERSA